MGGGWSSDVNDRLGLADVEPYRMNWRVEEIGHATDRDGTHGVARALPRLDRPHARRRRDSHSTTPPRRVGGNLDCKELVAGASLFLPVEVAGGLLSFGDGHGVAGRRRGVGRRPGVPDGDGSNWPSRLHKGAAPRLPYANDARRVADDGLRRAARRRDGGRPGRHGRPDGAARSGLSRQAAISLASLKVDLRITQVVNEVKGVHALLPPAAMAELGM